MNAILFAPLLFILAGCATMGGGDPPVSSEPPGDYYIGRRVYQEDFKFWGYVRSPGQPWKTAKLVMLNEQQKLAPDRAIDKIGSDNNYEYKLYGHFSSDTVYEPASNRFYPEFVLTGYDLVSTTRSPIFQPMTVPDHRTVGNPH